MPTYPVGGSIPTVNEWDELLTTTMHNYRRKLEDNIFEKTPLLDYLKGNAQTESGGYTIVVPLLVDEAFDADHGFYELYDTLNVTEDNRGITAAEYRWRQHAGSLAISGFERAINNGKHQIINLLEAKVKQLESTIASSWNAALYADPALASLAFNGLESIVSAGNPTRANLGGIDATVTTAWQSVVNDTAEVLSIPAMSNVFNSTSKQGEQPGRIFTTQELWEKYESLLQPQLRYSDAKVADAGFQNLLFKGKAVVWDPDCPAGTMYFINNKYVRLVKHSDVWLKHGKFVEREDKDAFYTKILSYGNLVASNRRKQGKLTNKTA